MKKLSTGADSNLKNWIELSSFAFGKYSKAVQLLKEKAESSPNGLEEEVIADEEQLIMVLAKMHANAEGNE